MALRLATDGLRRCDVGSGSAHDRRRSHLERHGDRLKLRCDSRFGTARIKTRRRARTHCDEGGAVTRSCASSTTTMEMTAAAIANQSSMRVRRTSRPGTPPIARRGRPCARVCVCVCVRCSFQRLKPSQKWRLARSRHSGSPCPFWSWSKSWRSQRAPWLPVAYAVTCHAFELDQSAADMFSG